MKPEKGGSITIIISSLTKTLTFWLSSICNLSVDRTSRITEDQKVTDCPNPESGLNPSTSNHNKSITNSFLNRTPVPGSGHYFSYWQHLRNYFTWHFNASPWNKIQEFVKHYLLKLWAKSYTVIDCLLLQALRILTNSIVRWSLCLFFLILRMMVKMMMIMTTQLVF
jgi:hypothetical protein